MQPPIRECNPLQPLQGKCNRLQHTGLEPGCVGIKIRVISQSPENTKSAHKPRLYVSCGTKDFLFSAHEKFVPALIENGWDVTRHDEPDAVHEWAFWDQEIRKFIEFMYSAQ